VVAGDEPVTGRPAAIGAWALCALTLSATAVAAVLFLAVAGTDWAALLPDATPPSEGVVVSALDLGWLTAFAVVGAIVASRRPRNPVGWLLCAIPACMAFQILSEAVYWYAVRDRPRDPGSAADLGIWLANAWWIPAVVVLFVFLPLLFPTGRPPTRRWRVVGWAAAGGGVVLFVGTAFDAGPLLSYPWVDNPMGVERMPAALGSLGLGVSIISSLLAAASVIVRFRRAGGAEREQLKWFTAAAAQLVALFAVSALLTPVIGDEASWAIVATGFLGVAVAVAVAILRYRLYDLDVVINRTLVYGALTATLAAAYLGGVLLLQLALSPLTTNSDLVIAGSTLAVAALFRPLRARIQGVVDRRFYRRKFDAQRTLETFSARLRDEVSLEALGAELRAVVGETMQPAHVSLWLRATGGPE
jgi:hypothetical protein